MFEGLALKSLLLLLPIVGLFACGAWLTLRSGVAGVAPRVATGGRARIAFENLTRMVVVLVAILGIFLAIQYLVGYRMPLRLDLVAR